MKTKTLKTFLIAAMLSPTLWISTASAEYLPEQAEQRDVVSSVELIKNYLSNEQFVASRLTLRRYSSDAAADLAQLALDHRLSTDLRQRAIKCLALYYDQDAAHQTINGLFKNLKPADRLYPQIIVSYLELHGESGAAQVAPLLKSDVLNVRMAAVIGLGRFGGQVGLDALKAADAQEQPEKVSALISQYIQ